MLGLLFLGLALADRAVIGKPIEERESWHVAAYLIAISPDLQQAVKARRAQEMEQEQTADAVRRLPSGARFERETAKRTFEALCVQCHALPIVAAKTADDVKALVARMVGNGLTAGGDELARVVFYLSENLATGGAAASPTPAPTPKGYQY